MVIDSLLTMKHLPFNPTPISVLPYFSRELQVNLISKRDDLFAEAGGGSKARMLQYILADVKPTNYDVLLTAGGPCSNFNRACALMCAKIGVPMHLVEYTDTPHEWESLNYFLCNLAGVRKTRCEKSYVADTIEKVVEKYQEQGWNVKKVYGGGRSVEGVYAYYDAVRELKNQVDCVDDVFLACGTGTTLTGVCAGMQEFFPNCRVHAISVARTWEIERKILLEDMEMLNNYLQTNYNFNNLIFSDSYLCGGYDKTTTPLLNTVKECISKEGMIIDPCYSGKAFYGMVQTIKENVVEYYRRNVLFWNTGGIINLLSMRNEYEF